MPSCRRLTREEEFAALRQHVAGLLRLGRTTRTRTRLRLASACQRLFQLLQAKEIGDEDGGCAAVLGAGDAVRSEEVGIIRRERVD